MIVELKGIEVLRRYLSWGTEGNQEKLQCG